MRKIITKEETEKKQKRNKLIVGIILIFTMLFSTIGYAFFNREGFITNQDKITYKGIDFIKNENSLWQSTINSQTFITFYNPKETENITLGFTSYINEFYNKPLYFVSGNQESIGEIMNNIGIYASRSQKVCLANMDCAEDLVVKNCTGNNIIIFKENEQIKLYKESDCIFIEAPSEQQVLATDRLIFKLAGVQN